MTGSSKAFLVVLLLMVGGGYYAFQQWNQAGGPGTGALADAPVEVVVPEGVGADEVGEILADAGVVRSATAFTAAARIDGRAGQIQPGTYTLDPRSTTAELLDTLTTVVVAPTFRVTIPEGLTVAQTLQRIADAEGSPHTVESLRAALTQVALPAWVPQRELPEAAEAFEGMLFPETYEFTAEAPPEEVLTRLVQQTDEVVTGLPATARNGLDPYQTLVLGSLIEREARLAEERPTISSVIHNRIEDGMALQIDATVVYGIERATGERPDRLVNADYQFDTPWSTYVYPGLPPTPISGVGRASLEAAALPSEPDFYFYVVSDPATGAHRFSRTLDEHNQAIAEIRGG
jgi:UPF0755 protein